MSANNQQLKRIGVLELTILKAVRLLRQEYSDRISNDENLLIEKLKGMIGDIQNSEIKQLSRSNKRLKLQKELYDRSFVIIDYLLKECLKHHLQQEKGLREGSAVDNLDRLLEDLKICVSVMIDFSEVHLFGKEVVNGLSGITRSNPANDLEKTDMAKNIFDKMNKFLKLLDQRNTVPSPKENWESIPVGIFDIYKVTDGKENTTSSTDSLEDELKHLGGIEPTEKQSFDKEIIRLNTQKYVNRLVDQIIQDISKMNINSNNNAEIEELTNKNQRLTKENEELKKDMIEKDLKIEQVTKENEELKKKVEQLTKENEKTNPLPPPKPEEPLEPEVISVPIPHICYITKQQFNIEHNGEELPLAVNGEIDDGTSITFKGRGTPINGQSRDLILNLQMDTANGTYQRKGIDLIQHVSFAVPSSSQGQVCSFDLQMPDGSMQNISMALIEGQTLTINGQGLTKVDGTRGNLHIVIHLQNQ